MLFETLYFNLIINFFVSIVTVILIKRYFKISLYEKFEIRQNRYYYNFF